MYHKPVLLEESIDALVADASGVYVDCTFGGGGHSKEILNRLNENGKLIAFDTDKDAKSNKIKDNRFQLVMQNFRYIKNSLRYLGVNAIDGLLADLGVSSHQFDTPERGFSTRFNSGLDMRMNTESKLTAEKILNEYEENKLADIFYYYGELRNARKLAGEIVSARKNQPIKSVDELKKLFYYVPKNRSNKFFAQMFQALRIEVNDELAALKELLTQSSEIIKPGGKMVVISYHSLEDRLVKRYMKKGLFEGEPERDVYGNWEAPFKQVPSKVVIPTKEEVEENPRARSAKMRIAIKN